MSGILEVVTTVSCILFIDEVYSLGNDDKKDSFSKECIDTINENLTILKTDFICIIAGYKEDIKNSWKTWNESKLDIMYDPRFRPGSGPSGSSLLGDRKIVEIF